MTDDIDPAAAPQPTRKRRTAPLKTIVGFLLLRLALVVILLIPALPRRSWDTSTKHRISGAVTVTRQTHVMRFGVPLQCADLRWHEWSATRKGTSTQVTDEHVAEFADQEYFAIRGKYPTCSLEWRSLAWRSARREELLLQIDPRALNLVVRWGTLGTNAAICCLLAGMCFCWIHKRRLIVFEQRRSKGLCGHCGYNLTGNVTGRCPECGTSIIPRNASGS